MHNLGFSTSLNLKRKKPSFNSPWLRSWQVPGFNAISILDSWIGTLPVRVLCSNTKNCEDLRDAFFKLTIQSRPTPPPQPPLEKLNRRSLQCEYSHLVSLLAARGVSRKRRAREMSLPGELAERGETAVFSGWKGSAEGKLVAYCRLLPKSWIYTRPPGTFGSLTNVRFAASKFFNDLEDSIEVLYIKKRISNQNYGQYLVDVSSIKISSFQWSCYLLAFILVFFCNTLLY